MRVWGHRFRQEVREGFSEEVTLSEPCLISRRQTLAVGESNAGKDLEV